MRIYDYGYWVLPPRHRKEKPYPLSKWDCLSPSSTGTHYIVNSGRRLITFYAIYKGFKFYSCISCPIDNFREFHYPAMPSLKKLREDWPEVL